MKKPVSEHFPSSIEEGKMRMQNRTQFPESRKCKMQNVKWEYEIRNPKCEIIPLSSPF